MPRRPQKLPEADTSVQDARARVTFFVFRSGDADRNRSTFQKKFPIGYFTEYMCNIIILSNFQYENQIVPTKYLLNIQYTSIFTLILSNVIKN